VSVIDEKAAWLSKKIAGITAQLLRVTLDPDQIPLATTSAKVSSATAVNVPASVTVVTLKVINTARLGFTLYNDANKDALVKLGSAASLTSFNIHMFPKSHYFMPAPIYTGIVTAIWRAGATGNMRVTEK